jgi:hypothetical protein
MTSGNASSIPFRKLRSGFTPDTTPAAARFAAVDARAGRPLCECVPAFLPECVRLRRDDRHDVAATSAADALDPEDRLACMTILPVRRSAGSHARHMLADPRLGDVRRAIKSAPCGGVEVALKRAERFGDVNRRAGLIRLPSPDPRRRHARASSAASVRAARARRPECSRRPAPRPC